MILKSFKFQCDFDFQIITSKMILILNHLYLGDLILIWNHQHMMILPISGSVPGWERTYNALVSTLCVTTLPTMPAVTYYANKMLQMKEETVCNSSKNNKNFEIQYISN